MVWDNYVYIQTFPMRVFGVGNMPHDCVCLCDIFRHVTVRVRKAVQPNSVRTKGMVTLHFFLPVFTMYLDHFYCSSHKRQI